MFSLNPNQKYDYHQFSKVQCRPQPLQTPAPTAPQVDFLDTPFGQQLLGRVPFGGVVNALRQEGTGADRAQSALIAALDEAERRPNVAPQPAQIPPSTANPFAARDRIAALLRGF